MEATEAAPYVYNIYIHFLKYTDEEWGKNIITTLFKFRYKEPQEFYNYYIDKCLNKPDNGYLFF
jgi:hypothetical protein